MSKTRSGVQHSNMNNEFHEAFRELRDELNVNWACWIGMPMCYVHEEWHNLHQKIAGLDHHSRPVHPEFVVCEPRRLALS